MCDHRRNHCLELLKRRAPLHCSVQPKHELYRRTAGGFQCCHPAGDRYQFTGAVSQFLDQVVDDQIDAALFPDHPPLFRG